MRANEILNEGWADYGKRINLPVSVQVYDEENDIIKNYMVPMTFSTTDVALALSYLLSNGDTGPGAFGMGSIKDTDLAADALMKYAGTYNKKAMELRKRVTPK